MAFDAFLKIEGIPGESDDEKHSEWIEILSYSLGISQAATGSVSSGGARTAGRSDHQDFSIIKELDKASPKLFIHCCNGTHIPKISLELCRATGDKALYMKYDFEDVIVSSYQPSGQQGGSDLPSEAVTFNYAIITLTYTMLDHKTGNAMGNIEAKWDQTKNSGG